MTFAIVWLPRADQDRAAQLAYIAEKNPTAAERQADAIAEHVRHLAQHPDMGRAGRVAGTLELVISRTRFVAVYRVIARLRRIEILRLLHGAQQWPPADDAEIS